MMIRTPYKLKASSCLVLAGLLLTTGCNNYQMQRLSEVGQPPKMQKTETPMEKPDFKPLKWGDDESQVSDVREPGSLWQPGSRAFFQDHRARRVGDIVKVTVHIADKAQLQSNTDTTRTSTGSASSAAAYGLGKLATKWIPGTQDLSNLFDSTSAQDHKGDGKIDRKETIDTEIAAMVTQILPNGNLVIKGSQEVRVNFELRQVSVSGIVRPEDISTDNLVDSNQIAEARIVYGGRGVVSDIQQPPEAHQLLDILSPF